MDNEIVVDIKNATVRFNKSVENLSGLKEYFIKFLKGQLMFQEFFALRDINFQVRKGESWGLIGKNGSGKSTLLKLISGVMHPYHGSVTVRGSIAPLIELGAGFDGELTARENIFLNRALLGYSRKETERLFDDIIDFAELGDFLDVPIKNFSSGMAARLGFSIATATKPDILIVDEVLAVGDADFQEKCKNRMKNLLSDGTTLLFVSHSIEQVMQLCSKAVLLRQGKIIESGNVEQVCEAYME